MVSLPAPRRSFQPHTINQAVLLRVAAALAELLRKSEISGIGKVAYKRRLRHWATECFILSFIVSLILPSATGAVVYKRKLWVRL